MSNAVRITDRRRSLILLNILITCIASSFLATALSTALPPIIANYNIDIATGQWLTSAYSLAMGIMMPLTAFLITRFPTKNLYLVAIALFLIGLAVCIFAPNFTVMMVGRILQACSNGITTSMAQVVLLSIYPPEKQGAVMGWYGLSVGAAPVIAPTLAGILVDSLGWKTIFIIPFFILLLSLICAFVAFDNVLETRKQSFDIISFILSGLGFGGITLGVGNISSSGITNPITFIPLVIGIVTIIIFVWRQLSLEQPFLELRIFRYKKFAVSVIGSMILYFIMMGGSLLMPVYVQSVLGRSATISGLVTLPGSLVMAFVSPVAGKLYNKMGMKKLAVIGSIGLLLGSIGMSLVGLDTPLIVPALLNALRCIAIGCLMMPFVTWGIGSLENKHTAHGSALLTSLRTISGAVGSAVFVGIMNAVAVSSAAQYGEKAGIHGMNIAFVVMSVVSVIMVMFAVIGISSKER
ncbi:MAG: multidrug efflux MFS transporter [Lachnospiraceae bacterium]|nr:multidrug efflux MFS transporter [Lachnospiraceae bacterium]